MSFLRVCSSAALLVAAGLLFACSTSPGAGPVPSTQRTLAAARQWSSDGLNGAGIMRSKASGKIQHVVVILQENRSFDDLFYGFPGADSQSYGYDSNGNKVDLQPFPLEAPIDYDHSADSFFIDCNGTGSVPGTNCQMNGFNNEYAGCDPSCPPYPQYAYVPHRETKPYFDIGEQYVVGDRMFTSHIDQSFISHQYSIAGEGSHAVDNPWGEWGCHGGRFDVIATLNSDRTFGPNISACLDNKTLGDEVDAAGLTWRFYASALGSDGDVWSAYRAIKHIRNGPDWQKDVISPQTAFFKDIKKGVLSNVTWITPTCATSDHAGCTGNLGPSWVASLVNAVGESKFWNSTAIFVYWDEWGGFYDHVPPPNVDYDGLGIRVPLLVVSAYAKAGYVSHVQYEHGSVLRFIEDQFGLGRLSASDARANSPADDCFDFTQPPRVFKHIGSPRDANYFESLPLRPHRNDLD